MQKLTFLLSFFLLTFSIQAQDLKRSRAIVDSLCAPYMHGRGYTNDGDKVAAQFIAKHFQQAGVKPFKESFYQKFQLSVNTLPNKVHLKIGKKVLELGTEFIADAGSGSGKGSGRMMYLEDDFFTDKSKNMALLQTDLSSKILVFDAKYEQKLSLLSPTILRRLFSAKAILTFSEKLTHRVSTFQYPIPKFIIQKEVFHKKIKKIEYEIKATMKPKYTSQNVIGYLEGTIQPDSFVVFTAHYDHLGDMGSVYFPGANDNASGVAMVLEMAYHYAQNPAPYSIAFMAFGAEEAGLVGSRFYTETPLFPLSKIKVLLNLDLFGTGEKGVTVVNGSVYKEDFQRLVAINEEKKYLTEIKSRGEAANSDHYFFHQKGVKSFFFYLMGEWQHYHDVNDRSPIPLTAFADAFKLIVEFADSYQK